MSLTLKSGASTDELTIEAVAKAARVVLYDTTGAEINPQKTDKFFMPISIAVTVVQAANSYIFTMRNGTTKTMNIEKLFLDLGFYGTAAATSQVFDLVRFGGATPTLGVAGPATTQVPKKSSTGVASTLIDSRSSGAVALGVVGLTIEPFQLSTFGIPRSVTGQTFGYMLDRLDLNLAPNEGLAIRATAATVVGDTIFGHISWSEK